MTAHLNLLSWLQEEDHDVWEYLFNNYLLPVIKRKGCLKEIRYIENKRLMKMINKFRGGYEGTSHDGRWFIRYNNLTTHDLKPRAMSCDWRKDEFDRPRCFGRVDINSERGGLMQMINQRAWLKIDGTKDQIIKHLQENEIKYKKSWKKEQLVKAMLSF